MNDNSYKTAIKRHSASAPLKYLRKSNIIPQDTNITILDFGCGRGEDVGNLNFAGYDAKGYDPYWHPAEDLLSKKYDIVLCTYVLNVVNKPTRLKIINQLKNLTSDHGCVYITVRRDIKKHTISSKGTHQYNVVLPLEIVKENSSYCIYRITND